MRSSKPLAVFIYIEVIDNSAPTISSFTAAPSIQLLGTMNPQQVKTKPARGNQWQLRAVNEKGRLKEAAKSLIPEAGHRIRTRDFDLGNFGVD